MIKAFNYLKIFIIFFISLFFSGCYKKLNSLPIKNEIEKKDILEIKEISFDRDYATEEGILFLPNYFNFRYLSNDSIFVADYFINGTKECINILKKMYYQDNWICEENIIGEDYISFTATKPDKSLYIICIQKDIKTVFVHSLINKN